MRFVSILHIRLKYIFQCFFWCFLPVLLSTNIYSQDSESILKVLAGQLQKASERLPAEEVYIQTSKGIYETGEDLWFKGYVLNAQYLIPSITSKTLYVKLLQLPEKKAVWKEKYAIRNGFVNGHLYVQDSLRPGQYVLVAQTPHSVGSDNGAVKSARKVEIVQRASTLQDRNTDTISKKLATGAIDFNLMPEGGDLVSGIQSKVAFKAVDKNGNPWEVSGTLFEGDKALLEFKSLHAGMGSFSLFPHRDKNYHIKLEGIPTEYHLPEIKPAGQALQLLHNTPDTLTFKITQSKDLPQQKMYIRIQIRGVVYGMAEINLDWEKLIKIPVREFPRGIAEVTLFNRNLEPVAERLVFIDQDRKLYIDVVADKDTYLTREKVKLKIQVADEKGDPVIAHLGLSVYDKIYDNPKDPKTIESHYLLSTSLRGRIYDPGYYFNPEHTNRQEALDLLMLTQGWRAYEWSEVNLEQQAAKKQSYITDTLTGEVYAKKTKARTLVGKQYILAFAGDPESGKTLIEVDSLGRYIILPEYLQQEKRGYVYFKLLTDTEQLGIRIDDSSFERLNKLLADQQISYPLAAPKGKIPISDERLYVVADDVNLLDEVVLTAKKKRVFRDKYMGTLDSLAKYEGNTDYVCQSNVLNCKVSGHSEDFTSPVEGERYFDRDNVEFNGRHWIVVDDKKHLPYEYPEYTAEELLEKYNLARVKAYYPGKEFYSPVYDKDEEQDGFLDYRNTLYWKPDIITNENGESEVEFYTSDLNTKFRGVIEGASGDGLLGNQAFEFSVKNRD